MDIQKAKDCRRDNYKKPEEVASVASIDPRVVGEANTVEKDDSSFSRSDEPESDSEVNKLEKEFVFSFDNSSDEEDANEESWGLRELFGDNSSSDEANPEDSETDHGKNRSKSSVVLGSAIGALSGFGFYKLSDSFRKFIDTTTTKTKKVTRNARNSVKNRLNSLSTKSKLAKASGAAVGLTLGALTVYVGYNKLYKKYITESK